MDVLSETLLLQREIEELITETYDQAKDSKLKRIKHERFLTSPLFDGLNRWFVALDASKPWIIYWILHSLDLLGVELSEEVKQKTVETLTSCQNIEGGYSGGNGQISHLATTYAAISGLAIVGTDQAFKTINRKSLYDFLLKMKQPDGSFRMHYEGEIDIRGTYCALNVALLLNILTPELIKGTSDFIAQCQTYEGGLGPFPNVEAHGGYTFCGLAAVCLIGQPEKLDIQSLSRWIVSRQMHCEGGFQGRTNKLVDGCYSFWQGGAGVLLECIIRKSGCLKNHDIYSKERLQRYLEKCCQSPNGGLRDKPGKSPDFYHSCYCLSGLSLCQNEYQFLNDSTRDVDFVPVLVEDSNRLKATHPIHNIGFDHVSRIRKWFLGMTL